jgi:syntaxin-binding protein 5
MVPMCVPKLTQIYISLQDAAAAAAHAKDKLMQRQEKLERISQRTAELESGAENFASLAQELAKSMENKKWWKL